jgi:hypothetical protein
VDRRDTDCAATQLTKPAPPKASLARGEHKSIQTDRVTPTLLAIADDVIE